MRRVLIGTVLGLLLLPPLLLLAFAATESGSRWTVQAGSRLLPGLAVTGVQGTFLTGMRLSDIRYQDEAGLQAHLGTLDIRWLPTGLLRGQLQLRAIQAEGLLVELPQTDDQYPIRLPQHIFAAPLALQLDDLSLAGLVVRQGKDQWQLEQLAFSARLDRDGLQLDGLRLEGEGVQLAASGRVAGQYPHRLSMRIDWQVSWPDLPEVAGRGEVSGDIKRLDIKQTLHLPDEVVITGSLTPDLTAGRHRFELTSEWAELAIPVGAEILYSRQGRLALKGEPDAYSLEMTTRAQHPLVIDPFNLLITGRGNLEQLLIERGELRALNGESLFSGRLSWAPTLSWKLSLQASAIDPGRRWPEWPGALTLDATLLGSLTAAKALHLDMDVQQLHGTLRGYPVDGHGQVSLRDDRLVVHGLKLRSGNNQARLDGVLRPRLEASFDLDAKDLRQLAPGLAGSLQGKGSLQGSLEDPGMQLDLHGRRLNLNGLLADELTLAADIDPANAQRSHWSLQSRGLEHQGLRLDTLSISGTGNAGQHQIHAKADGSDIEVAIRAVGGYAGQQWKGELFDLSLANSPLGPWQLENPVALQAGRMEVRVEPFCLTQSQARLCASGWRQGDGKLHSAGELSGLPLNLLKPWLTADTEIDGIVSGSFLVEGKPPQVQAEAMLQVTPGNLHYKPVTGPELIAEHHDGHVKLRFRDDSLEAQFGLGLGDEGRLQGKGSLGPGVAGPRALQAELDLALSDPGPLGALLPQFSDWSGAMQLRSRFAGTLQRPTVQLDGSWRDGQVHVADLGITLSAIQLGVTGNGDRLNLQGQAASGKGRVQFQGEAELDRAAGWPVRLHIDGENFEAARRSDLELTVSPRLDIVASQQEISVAGQLTVPYARIVVADLPRGVVRASSDEVILGKQETPDARIRHKGPLTRAQLHLILGDDVRLKAYGLDTRLAGELVLQQTPAAVAEAVGQLHLREGRYQAYGQDLTIEQGRLLFAGPLSSADVNVRAIRKLERIRAGILLTGPLVAPTTQLFSDPPMDEAEVLSYLLTGGPLSAGKELDAAMLAQAAVSLGLDKSTPITAQLAGSLGLDELGLAQGKQGLEGSAIAIGKQLSPDLYVRYLYGLFEEAATIQLRYKLNEHLRLEGGAGTQQSIDLLYEIEKE